MVYLPENESRSTTADYLFGVVGGRYFRIKVTEIRFCIDEKVRLPKINLIAYLKTHVLKIL